MDQDTNKGSSPVIEDPISDPGSVPPGMLTPITSIPPTPMNWNSPMPMAYTQFTGPAYAAAIPYGMSQSEDSGIRTTGTWTGASCPTNLPPASSTLTSGVWSEHKTKDGRQFWYSSETGKSTWDKPDELKTEEEKWLSKQTTWKEYVSVDGRSYWYNRTTKQSVWDMPEEVKKILDKTEEQRADPYTDKKEAKDNLKLLVDELTANKKLKWDEVLKLLQNDSRYAAFAILATGEKKQVYHEHQAQMTRKVKEEDRLKRKQAREAMVEAINSWSGLRLDSRYRDFAEQFHNEWWFYLMTEKERDEMFQDVMEEYERNDRDERKKDRSGNFDLIKSKIKETLKLNVDMKWSKVKDLVKANANFSGYDMMDIIMCWDSILSDLHNSEIRRMKKAKYRCERRNRDSLKVLLEQYIDKCELTAKTVWQDFVKEKELGKDSVYLKVLKQSGSKPFELFEDKKEKLIGDYVDAKNMIKKHLKNNNFEITSDTNFDEFIANLNVESNFPSVSTQNINLVFERLIKKASKQSSHESHSGDTSRDTSRQKRDAVSPAESSSKHKYRSRSSLRRRSSDRNSSSQRNSGQTRRRRSRSGSLSPRKRKEAKTSAS